MGDGKRQSGSEGGVVSGESYLLYQVEHEMLMLAYQAWLGFYLTAMRLLRIKDDLDVVRAANAYSEEILRYGQQTDLQSLPTFERKTLGKMGLSHEAKRTVNKLAPQPNEVVTDRKKRR